jgi:RNA polymerase sigma-70 factor (ECF subfamily)
MQSQKLGTPSVKERDLQNISLPSKKRTERFKDFADKEVARLYQESRSELVAEELVARLGPKLFNFILHRCSGDRHLAEDIVQMTFEKAFRKIDQFDASRPLHPWLLTIAANTVKTEKRRSSSTREVAVSRLNVSEEPIPFDKLSVDRSTGTVQELIRREQNEQVEKLLSQRLKDDPKLKELLPLYLRAIPYETISNLIGAPLGTIKSRLFRIRRAHEQILKQFD